jgi:hypothetical protein
MKLYNKILHTSQTEFEWLAFFNLKEKAMQTTQSSFITRATIVLIIIVQVALGIVFIFMPSKFSEMMGLEVAPAWTGWIFAQFGARCLGFAYGMFLALRNLARNASWLTAMIIVQIIDWAGTIVPLVNGTLKLSQVSTAPFLPVVFVLVLGLEIRRQRKLAAEKI